MQEEGVVAYASQKLENHERDYPTHDLELVVVLVVVKIWRHDLIGRRFELRIDHDSHQHIFTQRNLNILQWCWSELFSEYDFGISFMKGKENRVADALSQRPRIQTMMFLKVELRNQELSHLHEHP